MIIQPERENSLCRGDIHRSRISVNATQKMCRNDEARNRLRSWKGPALRIWKFDLHIAKAPLWTHAVDLRNGRWHQQMKLQILDSAVVAVDAGCHARGRSVR